MSLTLQNPLHLVPQTHGPTICPPSMFQLHYQLLPTDSTDCPNGLSCQATQNDGSTLIPNWDSKISPLPRVSNHTTPKQVLPRKRMSYTSNQLDTLEKIFSEKKYVTYKDRLQISVQVGVTEKQIKMWFQNRRTKMKRENWGHAVHCHSKNKSNKPKPTNIPPC